MRFLIPLLLLTAVAAAQAAPVWTLGAGFETRLQKEVNPDFVENKTQPRLFAHVRFAPIGVGVEVGQESSSSRQGALRVETQTRTLGLWGRYEYLTDSRWVPFAGLGVGSHFDRVRSSFGGTTDRRNGDRPFLGAGAGAGVLLFGHLWLETEARLASVQDREDPLLSFLFKIGGQF